MVAFKFLFLVNKYGSVYNGMVTRAACLQQFVLVDYRSDIELTYASMHKTEKIFGLVQKRTISSSWLSVANTHIGSGTASRTPTHHDFSWTAPLGSREHHYSLLQILVNPVILFAGVYYTLAFDPLAIHQNYEHRAPLPVSLQQLMQQL